LFIFYRSLFRPIFIHVERFPAAARSQAEEVGVVRHLHRALLASDVYGHRQPLAVGVPGGERGNLGLLQVFFEEQAQGRICQCQEEVVVG